MLFPTLPFLGFFALVFPAYWLICAHRWRMGWLLGASCAFYMSWNPWLICLILFSASIDYGAALVMASSTSARLRRLLLVGSISTNLGLLGFCKYFNFLLDSAGWLSAACGVDWRPPLLHIVLPLGISFYTFETISYIVDVYRGSSKPVSNLLDYALFIMFFPHLVAGPIVRPHDFLPQLSRRKRWSWNRLHLGLRLFLLGFCKKAILADHLASVADPIFKDPASYGSLASWCGVLAYTVQIYCDFSGYSDMAIGLAHMFGFKLPRNFNAPYLATSVADFWRRWHISLSSWLRDYLYKPLGGNRNGTAQTYRNLLIVMLVGGLWHGASWTFVAWGLFHGVLLALHRAIPWPRFLERAACKPLCTVGTFLLVSLGWVLFRSQHFSEAATILTHLFVPTAGSTVALGTLVMVLSSLTLIFGGGLLGAPARLDWLERRVPAPVMGVGLASVLMVALLLLPENGKAFIYFQF